MAATISRDQADQILQHGLDFGGRSIEFKTFTDGQGTVAFIEAKIVVTCLGQNLVLTATQRTPTHRQVRLSLIANGRDGQNIARLCHVPHHTGIHWHMYDNGVTCKEEEHDAPLAKPDMSLVDLVHIVATPKLKLRNYKIEETLS